MVQVRESLDRYVLMAKSNDLLYWKYESSLSVLAQRLLALKDKVVAYSVAGRTERILDDISTSFRRVDDVPCTVFAA